jgi:hypothetical protein
MAGPENYPGESPQKLGSLIDFAAERGLDQYSAEAWQQCSEAMEISRDELAADRGITRDQLHNDPWPRDEDTPNTPQQSEAA